MFAAIGSPVLDTGSVVGAVLLGVFVVASLFVLSGVRYIPNDRVGIVEKRWSLKGSVKGGVIALAGEAGFQPHVLRGGIHYLLPLQYIVHRVPLVTIPQGKLGYVFARDGRPLGSTQTLASNEQASDFLDAEAFLHAGGERGPQRKILRDGTYAINLAEFVVITENKVYFLPLNKEDAPIFTQMAQTLYERGGFAPVVIKGADDCIGVVTIHDGPSLPQGHIIAPVVGDDPMNAPTYHNNFQDPERFLAAGGLRGRQHQVLVEGTYFLNRLFATVEMIPKTIVEVGTVGVVVSYTGREGVDMTGAEYKHGELVQKGERGVWSEPLLPGKYAFNTYAGKVIMVPTTNFILKWNRSEVGAHHFDENLTEVSLITKDAFEPKLPLSVVVHIDYRKAPLVIQRFGDVKRLVEQTLDPMVAAYFKNVGQTRTVIQLIQDRSAIQELSGHEMKQKFAHYNLELEEVLIGTPTSSAGDTHIDQILTQLRARQIAEEQVETYARQERAAIKERELRDAEARAEGQKQITASELSVAYEANAGKAEYERSLHEAARMRALAEAEAEKIKTLADAEAEKAARIGIAQAIAAEEQVRAYGGPKFQVTQQVMGKLAEAIAEAKVDIVPRVMLGGTGQGSSNLFETLLAMLAAGETSAASELVSAASGAKPVDSALESLRTKVRESLGTRLATPAKPPVPRSTNGHAV
jgi:uncharacterized membrane protein YqiK